jgi:hypothetical protein
MPNEITLKKVSQSQIKKSKWYRAVYETDNGLTIEFSFTKQDEKDSSIYIEPNAVITYTDK